MNGTHDYCANATLYQLSYRTIVYPDCYFFRWSGFLLCAFAMLLVIFPMFTFPKKLPPRQKKKKKNGADNTSNDDDVLKEKSNSKDQTVASSMGFGKDIKGASLMDGYPKVMW